LGTHGADSYEHLVYGKDFAQVTNFQVDVYLSKDEVEFGFNREELEEFSRLKFINLFSGYNLQSNILNSCVIESRRIIAGRNADKKYFQNRWDPKVMESIQNRYSYLLITVETTGTNNPVAFFVEVQISPLSDNLHMSYQNHVLGYASRKALLNERV
jgi:hypothetical protein